MALRVPKFLTDLYNVASPEPGKLLGWGANGRVINVSPSSGGSSSSSSQFSSLCPIAVGVGQFVFVAGGGPQTDIADPSDFSKLPAIGCVISKPTAGTNVVQTNGIVAGLFAGLVAGKLVYLDANGGVTQVLPSPAPGSDLWLQPLGVALDAYTLVIAPSLSLTRIRG